MCGIAGFQGPFDRERLHAMSAALAHRGPDGDGHLLIDDAAGPVGLGHRRLSIIDLEGGAQPMWSAGGEVVIVFNGEIYNHLELRRQLEAAGRPFRNRCDTEAILQGYLQWGEGVVDRMEGMFAFALWDKRRRSWLFARDRFGIKPLYYCTPAPGQIAFASEIKPLLELLPRRSVNLPSLYRYLLFGWIAGEETIFSGVRQLPPAHVMAWAPDTGGTPRRYWRLTRHETQRRPQEWAAAIRDGLDASVASHLLADVPVGITLSGGLDSSAVLASMVRSVPARQVQAFTLGYGRPDDEIPYARAAAAHVGVEPGERIAPAEAAAGLVPHCLWHLEEPLAHPVMGTTWELARFVRERVKVVLIGEGSDELFGGYPQYRLFGLPFRLAPAPLLRRSFHAIASLMPPPATLLRLLAPPLRDAEAVHAAWALGRFDGDDLAEAALRFELETELVYNQLARIDKLTMAHSVEARVPFLDRAFAETAFDVPFDLKLRGGTQKHVLREAVRARLPEIVVERPKTGRGGTQGLLPLLLESVRAGSLSKLVTPEAISARGWLDAGAVADYLGAESRPWVRHHPVEGRRRAKFAFALAVLEQWARLFLDGERPH